MTKKDPTRWREATRLVRGGLDRSRHGETSEALYLTSGFTYESAEEVEGRFAGEREGFVYSRYGNPTVEMFETRLAQLEGAEACFATASGMAAVFGALASYLNAGDHLVAARAAFGSCYQIVTKILPRFGVECTLVDGEDLAQWEAAIRPNTKAFFFETPSNPTLSLVDIEGVVALAKGIGAKVVLDNVFATPLLQRTMPLGVDIVVYSATKHIDGQGRTMGGAILSSKAHKTDYLLPFLRHTGPALAPFNAWVMLKGMETLKLRVDAASASAARIADALAGMRGVTRVIYPHRQDHPQYALAKKQMTKGGTLLAFELDGGKDQAFALMNSLGIIDISNNLGDTKSLITHPATTTHRAVDMEERLRTGVTDGLVRLSVGLEDTDDLIEDLAQAIGA